MLAVLSIAPITTTNAHGYKCGIHLQMNVVSTCWYPPPTDQSKGQILHGCGISTGTGTSQPSNTAPAPTGTTGATQTSLIRDTKVRVRKIRRSLHKMLHPVQVHPKVEVVYQEQILIQGTWEQVGQASSVQHVESTHTGEKTAHMITFVLHVTIMIILHTCVGPQDRALQFTFTVAALTTGQVIAPETPGKTENNCVVHLIN